MQEIKDLYEKSDLTLFRIYSSKEQKEEDQEIKDLNWQIFSLTFGKFIEHFYKKYGEFEKMSDLLERKISMFTELELDLCKWSINEGKTKLFLPLLDYWKFLSDEEKKAISLNVINLDRWDDDKLIEEKLLEKIENTKKSIDAIETEKNKRQKNSTSSSGSSISKSNSNTSQNNNQEVQQLQSQIANLQNSINQLERNNQSQSQNPSNNASNQQNKQELENLKKQLAEFQNKLQNLQNKSDTSNNSPQPRNSNENTTAEPKKDFPWHIVAPLVVVVVIFGIIIAYLLGKKSNKQ